MSEETLKDMINKANPSVDGNTVLTQEEFVAMMAEAEFTSLFLEAFRMLDHGGSGWVQAGKVMQLLSEFDRDGSPNQSNTLKTNKLMEMMRAFGVDDEGHVDYAAFVNLLMSTSP